MNAILGSIKQEKTCGLGENNMFETEIFFFSISELSDDGIYFCLWSQLKSL